MVKSILVIACTFITSFGFSQETGSAEFLVIQERRRMVGYRNKGLLEASVTLAPSTMLSRKSNNFYLNAFAEYHFDLNVSLRSDNYLHLNALEDSPFINNAIRSYFGVFYHLNHNQFTNLDVTLGVQPGIVIMSKSNYDGLEPLVAIEPSRNIVSPSFALSVGGKFYVWKYFNFFSNHI